MYEGFKCQYLKGNYGMYCHYVYCMLLLYALLHELNFTAKVSFI